MKDDNFRKMEDSKQTLKPGLEKPESASNAEGRLLDKETGESSFTSFPWPEWESRESCLLHLGHEDP